VATGGLPHHNPLLVQIYADVLGQPIMVHPSQHGPALGAAILGVLAAGAKHSGFRSTAAAVRAMAGGEGNSAARIVKPQRANQKCYDALYGAYRDLAQLSHDLAARPEE
jgi:L-ribulokinase